MGCRAYTDGDLALTSNALREAEVRDDGLGEYLILRFGPIHEPVYIYGIAQARELSSVINEKLGKHYQPWPERIADEARKMGAAS